MDTLSIKTVGGILSVAAICIASACGGPLTYEPHGTPRAPEADAHLTARVRHEQALTELQIHVEHLAPPDRITPAATTYVAWVRRNDAAPWVRLGSLIYNPSAREGNLTATAPETAFQFTITTEAAADPPAPSENVIVVQDVGAAH